MAITKLVPHSVAKPWGRTDVPTHFGNAADVGERVGEIWFEHPDGLAMPLLVKYLFTSEKLSVQVHPDDARAAASGAPSGKDEAWVITSASAGAQIGLGLRQALSGEALRAAALDGSIEQLLEWRAVRPGDHFHVSPGTIHAIGAGITMVEVQQYADITYRLYDYGRPRDLHLEAAIEAADAGPYRIDNAPFTQQDGSELLVAGPHFRLVRQLWKGALGRLPQRITGPAWFIPLTGEGTIGDQRWQSGDCFLIEASEEPWADGEATALFACAV